MEPYVYEPLPDGESIRVLSIEPLKGPEDDIRCSLAYSPITNGVKYTALSYSWGMDGTGDASLCERIVIDGRNLAVTRNLYQGLRRVVPHLQDGMPMWIDAVCINQRDDEERSAQVAKMGKIFSNAAFVFAWLGEGDDEAESDRMKTALDCMSRSTHRTYHEHVVETPDGIPRSLCLARAAVAARSVVFEWPDARITRKVAD